MRVIKDKLKDLLSFEEWKKEKGSADSRTSASNSERSGAISGNSSSNGLLHESSGHLSRYSLASQEDIAKLLKNTQITLASARQTQREGWLTLTLESAAAYTSSSLSSLYKCNKNNSNEQALLSDNTKQGK